MNEYFASPVTLIVLVVVAVAAIIAIIITVRSNQRKERAWEEERRAIEKRVTQRIADEREGRDRPPRRAKPLPLPVGRRGPGSVQRSTTRPSSNNDDLGLFIPSLIVTDMVYSDPTPSRDDSGSSSNHSSNHSSSYDSGSSSSSSDSGSSSGGSDGGGGGGGGE